MRAIRWPIRCAVQTCWLIAGVLASPLTAEERLADLPAFDVIVLNAANNHAELRVLPLELPGRRMPAVRSGNLPITLVDDPTQPLEVPWESVTDVRFFEQSLLTEANRLTQEKKFDDAFDYLARLNAEYPRLPGVEAATDTYLRANALELFQSQQLDRAIAVLMSLYDRSPNSPGLGAAVDAICGRMIEQHLRQQNYAAARAVLELWRNEFQSLNSQAAAAWEQRFEAAARRQLSDARQWMADEKYVAARKAIGRARDIWPQSTEAAELLAAIQQQYPAVSVGVFEPAPEHPKWRIDDWASLRTSRLVQPLVAELVEFSPEGGVYRSPFGEWVPDESGLRLSLQLKPPAERSAGFPSADVLARFFLHMADPQRSEYRPEFASIFAGVSVDGDEWVHLDWKRPHVRPESLLQVPLVVDSEEIVRLPEFERVASDSGTATFAAIPRAGGTQPWVRTIVEQTMPSDEAAVAALLHGEIDVLDRVPTWQVERLRNSPGVRLDSYKLPTVHVLLPNPDKPLLASREFRRALCFAIERERIVREVLLGGVERPGFQVLSGPFPAGLSFGDPLRYAYNNQLAPRPFEPRLGAVLATIAWAKVTDPTGESDGEIAELPALVLAHPIDPIARVACETIKLQLARAGIRVELREVTADELSEGKVDFDLRYAELAVWEPLADARQLLGAGGLSGNLGSPHLNATLRQLDKLTNWRDVRAKMSEIHDVAYHDLPVVPLWQTLNYFAYRTAIHGVGESPVVLYQNIDRWRIESPASELETARAR